MGDDREGALIMRIVNKVICETTKKLFTGESVVLRGSIAAPVGHSGKGKLVITATTKWPNVIFEDGATYKVTFEKVS